MFALVPFVLLAVRLSHFSQLTVNDLPSLSEDDLQRMRRSSQVALILMAVFSGLSFVPYGCIAGDDARFWAFGITCVGLAIAAVFDLKAERIKRRGLPGTALGFNDEPRWYHVVIAVMLPYVALPWGIVNLVRGRKRSGFILVVIPAVLFLFALITILVIYGQGGFHEGVSR